MEFTKCKKCLHSYMAEKRHKCKKFIPEKSGPILNQQEFNEMYFSGQLSKKTFNGFYLSDKKKERRFFQLNECKYCGTSIVRLSKGDYFSCFNCKKEKKNKIALNLRRLKRLKD